MTRYKNIIVFTFIRNNKTKFITIFKSTSNSSKSISKYFYYYCFFFSFKINNLSFYFITIFCSISFVTINKKPFFQSFYIYKTKISFSFTINSLNKFLFYRFFFSKYSYYSSFWFFSSRFNFNSFYSITCFSKSKMCFFYIKIPSIIISIFWN